MKKIIIGKLAMFGVIASMFIATVPSLAFAHVVVSPKEALTGAYEIFTTSVPNEKDIPVTGLRLVIPEIVESVTPTAKPGWQIETKKSGDKITEIIWTGGTIPPELRDDFTFSAHLPSVAGDINWKAYETYQDGSVVSWDQKPTNDEHESENVGPYSTTTVSDSTVETPQTQNNSSNIVLYVISIFALALGALALVRTTRK